MPMPLGTEFTHGSFDNEAVSEYLNDADFVEAFATCMHALGTALVSSPKTDEFTYAIELLRNIDLEQDWPFGQREVLAQCTQLIEEGKSETQNDLLVEYTRLFRGPAALPAPPWGSVYMDHDKVMYGWTWVELRRWLRAHGIEGTYEENDPEDNFARMLALAGILSKERPELLGEFLADHLLCWCDHFLEQLEPACESPTYRALALLSRTTMQDIQQRFGIEPAKRTFHR